MVSAAEPLIAFTALRKLPLLWAPATALRASDLALAGHGIAWKSTLERWEAASPAHTFMSVCDARKPPKKKTWVPMSRRPCCRWPDADADADADSVGRRG